MSRTCFRAVLILGSALIFTAIALFLLIQLVPFGRDHSNPPVVREPVWDSPRTRQLAVAACYDCHSNETVWPGYANLAPFSWLVQRDVEEGREKLNFSNWRRSEESDEAVETLLEGEMPPLSYTLLHPSARLSAAEKQELAEGLRRTLR